MYTCILDASKTFDRINHWTLFHELINCKIPLIIIQILIFWNQTQLVRIKWGKSTSEYFSISKGVRQGGILSPKLFAAYMNSLTNKLIDCKAECYIDMQCINHVLYADDICLMTPTATAMQCMLDICYNYGLDNDVLCNPLKSVYMLFIPTGYTCMLYRPNIMIGIEVLKYVDHTKYLGITFCETIKDDKDMIRQMRLLYAKSNKLLRIFSHCTTDVKLANIILSISLD